MQEFGKLLILLGTLLLVLGLALVFWPQLSHIPILRHIGRLPGDIAVKRENFRFYFPLGSSLLLSLILSLLLYWFGSWRR